MRQTLLILLIFAVLGGSACSAQWLFIKRTGVSPPEEPNEPNEPPAEGSYYIDPLNGSDDANGLSVATAWKTVQHAEQTAVAANVYLLDGDYEAINITALGTPRSSWSEAVTFQPYPGDDPNIEQLYITGQVHRYMTWDGLDITYPNRGTETWTNEGYVVWIQGGLSIRIKDSVITGVFNADPNDAEHRNAAKYAISKIFFLSEPDISHVGDILIDGCTIQNGRQGLYFATDHLVGQVTVQNSIIRYTSSSLIVIVNGVSDCTPPQWPRPIFQDNHLYGHWEGFANDFSESAHGSGFYLNSDGIIIRRNVIESYGTTAALRTYPVGTVYYKNMTIENNLILHPLNMAFQFYRLGGDSIIANNTVIGVHDAGTNGYYFGNSSYNLTNSVESTDGDVSNLTICNNLFLACTEQNMLVEGAHEEGNIFWSIYDSGSGFMTQTTLTANFPGNLVLAGADDANLPDVTEDMFAGGTWYDSYAFAPAVQTDPKTSVEDYKWSAGDGHADPAHAFDLVTGALAVDYGTDVDVDTDFWGDNRDASPDAGYDEYVGESP